jgi:hypothetical protein
MSRCNETATSLSSSNLFFDAKLGVAGKDRRDRLFCRVFSRVIGMCAAPRHHSSPIALDRGTAGAARCFERPDRGLACCASRRISPRHTPRHDPPCKHQHPARKRGYPGNIGALGRFRLVFGAATRQGSMPGNTRPPCQMSKPGIFALSICMLP